MSVLATKNPPVFIISYDGGKEKGTQTFNIPHNDIVLTEPVFKKFLTYQKCLKCDLETDYIEGRFL